MTDNGYDNRPRTNGHYVHENGAANGRDADTALMLLETPPLPVAPDGELPGEAAETHGNGQGDDLPPDDPNTDQSARAPDPADGADEPQADDSEADRAGAEEQADHTPQAARPEFTDEDRLRHLRMGEALLFASDEPLRTQQIAERLPDGADVEQVLADLAEHYAERGVNLVRVAGGWAFRTATDLSFLMERERVEQRKLSRAALETLAIIAYHQPVTRAEIEDVRGVSVSKGTLDVLMEIGWVRVRGRRQTPGRPVTYGTSDSFLEHFGLDRVSDLPGLDELKAAGLLDTRMPTNISIPRPSDEDDLDGRDEGDAESEDTDLGYARPDTEEDEEEIHAGIDQMDDSRTEEAVSDLGPTLQDVADGDDLEPAEEGEDLICEGMHEADEFDDDAQTASEFEVESGEGVDAWNADDLPSTDESGADAAEAETGIAELAGDGVESAGGAGETGPGGEAAEAEADETEAEVEAEAGETLQTWLPKSA